jgi:predicted nucleotidyltransferase
MHANIEMLATVARRLGTLKEDCVFVGGATVPLFVTDPAAPSPRPTKDVDVIVELATRAAYYRFADKLRERGFREDVEANILCRWTIENLIVDVMPTEAGILGFSNRWYSEAIATAGEYSLAADLQIRLVTPAYFLATKMEAFAGRGHGDFLLSNDIEDIVTILDGRVELLSEIADAAPAIREFLAQQFSQWLQNEDFLDALSGHLLPDAASQARYPLLLDRVERISALK